MAKQEMIRIRLKAYDHSLIDSSAEKCETCSIVAGKFDVVELREYSVLVRCACTALYSDSVENNLFACNLRCCYYEYVERLSVTVKDSLVVCWVCNSVA